MKSLFVLAKPTSLAMVLNPPMSPPAAPSPLSPEPSPLPSAVMDEYADPGARAIDLTDRPVADSLREIMASSPRLPRELPPPLLPAHSVFTNRHWTLAGVGLLLLLVAFGLAGETVWHLVVGGLDVLADDEPERARLLIGNPAGVMGGLVFGLGLILARRWARQLVLAGLLSVLLWGLVSACAIAVNNGLDFSRGLSAYDTTPAWVTLAVIGGIAAVAWVLLAVLSHRNVRLTCENAQPAPDWTDRRAPSELLLIVTLLGVAVGWARLATFHAWPYWGDWRVDYSAWVWSGAAFAASASAVLVALRRPTGVWFAAAVVAASASSIVVTAWWQPVEASFQVWNVLRFNQFGGIIYVAANAFVTVVIAIIACLARRRRQAAPPPASNVR